MDLLERAARTLRIEGEGVRRLAERLDGRFLEAVDLILRCPGRVVVTGMGKSGLVGRKVASTLASVGVPALFLHPAEGVHGDLGMVARGDVVLAISNSGETEEILRLLEVFARLGLPLISMTGSADSTLARRARVWLDIGVEEEACPMNLVPTASTTAALAMGDALAMAVLEARGVREEDFALLHPAGVIGRKLLQVGDLMHTGEEVPAVGAEAPMKEVIVEMSRKRLGMTCVVGEGGVLVGIITDGDLRRALERKGDVLATRAREVMTPTPKLIEAEAFAAAALRRMEEHAITSLIVVDERGRPRGVIHMHDILRAGVV
ncbi:MAG: SIS domain-containing protein [Nitrospinota bacterium]